MWMSDNRLERTEAVNGFGQEPDLITSIKITSKQKGSIAAQVIRTLVKVRFCKLGMSKDCGVSATGETEAGR